MRARPRAISFILCLVLAVALILVIIQQNVAALGKQTVASQLPADQVASAWQQLTASAGYSFKTQLVQENIPAPRLGNVGRSSQVKSLYLEGELQREESNTQSGLHLWLWDGLQNAGNKSSALEVRINGDQAQGRMGSGEWKSVENIGALVAPGTEMGSFLVGARHISQAGSETRQMPTANGELENVTFAKFSFALNGSAISDYTNQQINRLLQQRGELPPGLRLQAGNHFDNADGLGELWLDPHGLPARLKIDIQFPQAANGDRLKAQITTDFYNLASTASFSNLSTSRDSSLPRLGRVREGFLRVLSAIHWQQNTWLLLTLALFGAIALGIIRTRRQRVVYQSLTLLLVAQMLLAPVASIARADNQQAQIERFLAERGIELASDAPDQNAVGARNLGTADQIALEHQSASPELHAPISFNSSRSPLEVGKETYDQQLRLAEEASTQATTATDSDKDGLDDALEASWGTSASNPDSDGDGLKDGQEAITCEFPAPTLSPLEDTYCSHPKFADTDGDGLSDSQEFLYLSTQPNSTDSDRDSLSDMVEVQGFGGKYSDPRNPDTDNDGLPDGKECPSGCPDSDNDGVLDLLDDDSDNDGFFDTVDSAPTKAIGTLSTRPFNGDNPLKLNVQNLQANHKLFVDFQVRPASERLAYPTSVLDWPTGDTGGQVQRRLDTTFAEVWNSPEAALANGDMRLVPMLELRLDSSAPLPRTTAALSSTLLARTPLGNVRLIDNTEKNRIEIRLSALDKQNGESFSLKINTGTCQNNTPLHAFDSVDGQQTYLVEGKQLAAIANGGHVLILASTSESLCQPIDVAPENTVTLPFLFQRTLRLVGSVAMTQTGANIQVGFAFKNNNPSYEMAILQGSCSERGAQLFAATNLRASSPNTSIPGNFLTNLADAGHILILKEAGAGQSSREILCQPLPNLVNGNASQTTMIDQSFLTQFNATVHEADANGTLIAYVPATTVMDERSGRTAGLGARMTFDTSFGTSLTSDVRLVWQVQVLSDFCSDPPADFQPDADEQTRLTAWCGGSANQLQVVHQYVDEGWTLAGLSVREDHALRVAAIYEDPDSDQDLASNDRLWHLADGLKDAFLQGRAASANSPRDLTVQTIYDRFRKDSPINDPTLLWGMTDHRLDVRLLEKSSSLGWGEIVQNDVPALLDQKFLDGTGMPRTLAPLILYAGEETFRTTELDLAGYNTVAGNQLTVNFAAGTPLQATTVTSLNWKAYQRSAESPARWQAVPLDVYWQLLEKRLATSPAFLAAGEADADLMLIAQTRIAQVYFTELYGGRSNLVQVGSTAVNPSPEDSVSDSERQQRYETAEGTAEFIEAGGLLLDTLNPVIKSLAKQYMAYTHVLKPLLRRNNLPLGNFGAKELLKIVGSTIKYKTRSNWNNFLGDAVQYRGIRGKSGARIGVLVAGLSIASALDGGQDGKVTFGSVAGATLNIIDLAVNIQSLVETVKAAREATSAAVEQSALAAAKVAERAGEVAGFAATLIGEAVAWGALIYTIASAGLTPFGLQANELAASGIAGSYVAFALLALALSGPGGAIAAAVIGVIDSLITLVCGFIPSETVEANIGLQYFCKGLTGLIAEAIAYIIYANQEMVTLSDPYRVQISHFAPTLKIPQNGFISQTPLDVHLKLQNTLQLSDLPITIGALYGWQYNEAALRSSSFVYDVVAQQETDQEKELHNQVQRDQHPSEWQKVSNDAADGRFAVTRTVSNAAAIQTDGSPGINRPVAALLAEGYAIPVQECVLIYVPLLTPVPVPTCWVREKSDTNYTNLGIEFDLFPATLTEFMALSNVGDGKYAQSWGQNGAIKLPPLRDADGDGLPASVDGNDSNWDSDGDGISDAVEIERGSSPNSPDSDSDGLPDWRELLAKTNPMLADSDGDGALDGEEVTGWDVVYSNAPLLKTTVIADPLRADADEDGLPDKQEKNLGFSPYAVSDRNALEFETTLSEPYAPDLLLTFDEAADERSFQNSADPNGATLATCKNDKPIGLNVSLGAVYVDMGSNPTGGDFTVSVNGVDYAQPIKATNGEAFLFASPIPIAATQGDATPVVWTLTHSNGLQFTQTSQPLTIGDHDLAVKPVYFSGPNGSVVSIFYLLAEEDGHCPISGLDGYYGNALKFDGLGDALIVSGNNELNQLARNFVISAWIRPDNINPNQGKVVQVIFATPRFTGDTTASNMEFGLAGTELYFGYVNQSNSYNEVISSGANFVAGKWSNVRLEMENPDWQNGSGTVRLYKDGVLLTSQAVNNLPSQFGAGEAVYIGGQPDFVNEIRNPFAGLIDELVVVTVPEGSPLSAASAGLMDARYNLEDGLLARKQTVGLQVGLGSRLLNREIQGIQTVYFPQAVFPIANRQSEFSLPPAQPSLRSFDALTTVNDNAPAGEYQIAQDVGATVAVPNEDLPPAQAGAAFEWRESAEFAGSSGLDFAAKPVPLTGDFTLSAWVKPGAPENQRRGILGRTSHTASGYPALEVQNNRLWFGYGDGTAWREVQSPQTLNQGLWNYVAVSYKKSTHTATFYVNGTGINDGKDALLAGDPSTAQSSFFIGRSSNQATLNISKVETLCEYDYGGEGEYSLLNLSPFTGNLSRVLNFTGSDGHVENGPWSVPISDGAILIMCEDDDNNLDQCGGSDEQMGLMFVSAAQPATTSEQSFTFSDRPEDPSCTYSFGFGWPESAVISYTLTNPTLPFVGTLQNVTVFNTYKDQSAVDGLRRGITYLADFRFDEAPDSSRFEDFSSFHEATCNKAAGQCPASGLPGLDEQALDFDGVNDYLAADTLAQAAAENSALTFGAWVKPDSINGVSAVMGFNKANGGFGNLLLLQADGSNHFKPVYYDPVVGSVIGSSFQMGGWFHVAVTIDSSNQGTLYLNSQPLATFSTTARPEANGKFSIGQSWNQGAIYYPFDGMIDRAFLGKKAFNEIELELEMKRAPFKRWTMDADNLPLNLNNGADYLLESGVRGDSLKLDDDAYAVEAGFETAFPFVQRTSGGPFTASIWLKGDTLKKLSGGALNQTVFAIGAEGASNSQLKLSLLDGVPVVNHRQANTTKTLSASQSLSPNVWQQVTLRHDAGAMSLFVNGTLIQTVSNWDGAAIAPGPAGITLGSFQGLLDEFTVYQAALTDREIREQYNRQNAWMEDQHSLRLTVSVEPPQVALPIESSYFAQQDTQVLIKTSSQFAQTLHADLLIQGTTRTPAAAVLDAEAGSAWMATFAPTLGERAYTLQARASDNVGNQSDWSAAQTIYVDGTPPMINIVPIFPQPARLTPAPGDPSSLLLHLFGDVYDPALKNTAIPGSGVAWVEVTVYNAKSQQPVAGTQRATLDTVNKKWSIDYRIQADQVTGQFVVDVIAQDQVGNRTPSIFNQQAILQAAEAGASERTLASQTVLLDSSAPQSTITSIASLNADAAEVRVNGQPVVVTTDTVIAGTVLENPQSPNETQSVAGVQSVEVSFQPLAGSGSTQRNAPLPTSALLYLPLDESSLISGTADVVFGDPIGGNKATCSGKQCPTSGVVGKSGQALRFDDLDDQLTVANAGRISSKTNNFTLAAWIRPNDDTGHRRILMTGDANAQNGFGIGLDGNSHLLFTAFGVNDYELPYTFVPNRWVHVAVAVAENGAPSFFVNGRLIGTQAAAGQIVADGDNTLVIGRNPDGTRFNGLIDEVMVFGAALNQAEIARLMNEPPTIHIPFDERLISGDLALNDASGLGSSALRTAPDGTTSGAMAGKVGDGALHVSSALGENFTLTPQAESMPRANEAHSIAGWFKLEPQGLDLPSKLLVQDGGTTVESFEFNVGIEEANMRLGPPANAIFVNGFAINQWQHVAITYDGTTYRAWLNGKVVGAKTLAPFAFSANLRLTLDNFAGALDDLRIYRRALNAGEVQQLALIGWERADLGSNGTADDADSADQIRIFPPNPQNPRLQSGNIVTQTNWQTTPPLGLEGYYSVRTRAIDSLGNYVADGDTHNEWQGTVDTLAPRTSYSTAKIGANWVYTFSVIDFNLNSSGLAVPDGCMAQTSTTLQYFRSPWYLALAQQAGAQNAGNNEALNQRVYSLTTVCTLSSPLQSGAFSICDVAGNCAALNWDGTPGSVQPGNTRKIYLPLIEKQVGQVQENVGEFEEGQEEGVFLPLMVR